MHLVSANGKERFRALLFLLKVYTVIAPFVLIALVSGAGFSGALVVDLVPAGHLIAFMVWVIVGISQSSAGLRKSSYSSFLYAGVALFWILVVLVLLPSLAHT